MIFLSGKASSARLSSAKEKNVVLLMHGWNAGSLLVLHSNAVTIATRYTLTGIFFKVSPRLIYYCIPTPVFMCICVNYRRAHGMIDHL